MNLDSFIGPVIVCKSNKKVRLWNFSEEKLYCINDESEFNFFHDNHVYAPNINGYSYNMNKDDGFLKVLPSCYIDDIFHKFIKDFKTDIGFIESYYGKENVEVVVAAYGYYN